MPLIDWLQLGIYIAVIVVITKYLGAYLVRVLDPDGKTFLDKLMKPLERLTYRLFGIDPHKEQNWKQYTVAMLLFSAVSLFFTYIILRIQQWLPLNPQGLPNLSPHLAFNTAVSFTTNTNWQSYAGEATMSYFSQMVALVIHNFVSAATGIALAAALVRGIARHTATTIGNFWTDLTRTTYYLLLPIAFVFAVVLVAQGIPQNFHPYTTANVVQPTSAASTQSIPQGPIASQEAIKMIGTNGGGYLNANSAAPYENPNGLSNFLEMFGIIGISSALTYYYGRMVKNQKHGWAIWAAMLIVFLVGFFVAYHYEQAGNPIHQQLGVAAQDGNMEGKEVRFGIFNSSLFATLTTDASNGGVNSMHDSFTPLGGIVPLVNMELGEIIFGGVGSGLYGIIVFAILAVFIAGLMIGRTPEYLGQKIEAYDVKVSMLSVLAPVFTILGFTALAATTQWGLAGLNNAGPHGFSEILYAFSSATGNNGSAFAGLTANAMWYDTTLGLAMFFGRFITVIPVMALAGSFAQKKLVPQGQGSFPVTGPIFVILLIAVVLLVGALTFFPALTLGPIVEHFLMHSGTLF
ncbi:MAG TPA: potassium-transporting ATPase subunit KdpA [Candidatus Paceibacterota bacterium]|nr:potassium-transporting ATPase subunit KdpA [Candidatus Paceibacterota bacterium]